MTAPSRRSRARRRAEERETARRTVPVPADVLLVLLGVTADYARREGLTVEQAFPEHYRAFDLLHDRARLLIRRLAPSTESTTTPEPEEPAP